MFDIGFSEILLIFGLALIVLGPEKLPRVASQVGRWIGRARGMARQFREQLEEEVNLEEARKSRPPAITQSSPTVTPAPVVTAPPSAAIEAPATGPDANPPIDAVAAPHSPAEPPLAAAAQTEQPSYPDHYSHAHPTDSEGRPLPSPSSPARTTNDPPATESAQHDWVGRSAGDAVSTGDDGVTPTDKPAQGTTAAGYAPSHERGT